ncbi:MAG: FadR family transcriptional regulator, partial [Rhizobiaceae bacterium]|nr:FadR family transcriptional regulator [Rhizobiaceae bacterium]
MPSNVVFRREKISDQLYNDLLNSILVGDFPPLSSLPTETHLVSKYGIPRTTVRSALAQLKDEGFLVSRQGSGTIVTENVNGHSVPFTPDESLADLEKCIECRIALEPGIAEIAAEHRTDEDVAFLNNHIIALAELADVAAKQSAEDADFHLRLAEISGNKYFVYIMRSLQPHILFAMNIIKTLPGDTRR